MLIDINLLPQKEHKRRLPVYIAIAAISMALLGTVFLIIYTQVSQQKLDNLTKELEMKKEFRIQQETAVSNVESSDGMQQLQTAVKWAEEYPIDTVPVLEHLTSLLPERGFFRQFNYTEDGKINLNVQFDTSRQAAYFLNDLKNSDWIVDVKLASLETTSQAEAADETTALTEDQLMPRYLGQYEISLNQTLIKNELHSEDEGGDE
ncbi:pilus assembly protein PilN [Bacillus salacetis]|uniref:Pilus assembly protein PilN n=1 Tax=Bacillus salacetis TaxID=2315464 RepID=A0A3A1R533_9BACI|nr:PilN domain-containing protein [Bacillus salacetis]RIW37699.1 pilus assembly protein PilN [Bacillus salacetis]